MEDPTAPKVATTIAEVIENHSMTIADAEAEMHRIAEEEWRRRGMSA